MDGTINSNSGSANLRRAYVCIPDKPVNQVEANEKQTPVQNVFLRNGNLISISIGSGQHSSPPNQARINTNSQLKKYSRNIEKNNLMLALPTSNFQQHSNLVFVNVNNQPTELKEHSVGTPSDKANDGKLDSKSEKTITNNSWKASMDQHPSTHSMIVEVENQKEDSTVIDLTGDGDLQTELKKQSIQTASYKTNVVNLGNKTIKAITTLTDDPQMISLDQHQYSTIVEIISDDDIETENPSSKKISKEILLTEEDLLCEKYYNDMRDIIENDVIPEVNVDYLLSDINIDEIVDALKECNTLHNKKEATVDFMNDSSTIFSPSTTINLESSQSQMVTHNPNVNNAANNTSAENLQKVNQIINLIKYDEQKISVASTHEEHIQAKHSLHRVENMTTDFSISPSVSSELNIPLHCDAHMFTSANQQLKSRVTKPLKSGMGTTIVENSQLVNDHEIKKSLSSGAKITEKIIAAPGSYSVNNNPNDKSRDNDDKRPVSSGERSQPIKEKTNQKETSQSINDFDIMNLLSSGASANVNTVKVVKSLKSSEGATASGARSKAKKVLESDEKIVNAPNSYSVCNKKDHSRNKDDKQPSVSGGENSQPVRGTTNLFKTDEKFATIVETSQSVNNSNIKHPLSSEAISTVSANLKTVKVTKSLKTGDGAIASGARSQVKKALHSDEQKVDAPGSYLVNTTNGKSRKYYDKTLVSSRERTQSVKEKTNQNEISQVVNGFEINNLLSSGAKITGSANLNTIKVIKSLKSREGLIASGASLQVQKILDCDKKIVDAPSSYSVNNKSDKLRNNNDKRPVSGSGKLQLKGNTDVLKTDAKSPTNIEISEPVIDCDSKHQLSSDPIITVSANLNTVKVIKSLKTGEGLIASGASLQVKKVLDCDKKIVDAPSSYSVNNKNDKLRNNNDKRPVSGSGKLQLKGNTDVFKTDAKSPTNIEISQPVIDCDSKHQLSSDPIITVSANLNIVKATKSLKTGDGATASDASSQVKKALDSDEQKVDAPGSYSVNTPNNESRYNDDKRLASNGERTQSVKEKNNQNETSQAVNEFDINNILSSGATITASANFNTVKVIKSLKSREGARASGASLQVKKVLDCEKKIVDAPGSYSVNNKNDKLRNKDDKRPISGGAKSQPVKGKTNLFKTHAKVATTVEISQSVTDCDSKHQLSSDAIITVSANLNTVKAAKSLKTGERVTASDASSQAKKALDSDEKIMTVPSSYSVNNTNEKSRNNDDNIPVSGGEISHPVKEKANVPFKSTAKFTTIVENLRLGNDLNIKTRLSSRAKITASEKFDTVKVNKSLDIAQSLVVPSLNSVKTFTAVNHPYTVSNSRNQLKHSEIEFAASTVHKVNNNNEALKNGKKCTTPENSYSMRDQRNQLINSVKTFTDSDASSQSAMDTVVASTLKDNKNICTQKPEATIANSKLLINQIKKPLNTDKKSKQFNSDGKSKYNNLHNSKKLIGAASHVDIKPADIHKNDQMLKRENFKYKKSPNRSSFAALINIGPTHSFGAIINSNLALKNYVIPRIRKDLGINKLNNADKAKNITFEEKNKDAKMFPIPHPTSQNNTSAKRNDTVMKAQPSLCEINTSNFNEPIQKANKPKNTHFPNTAKLHSETLVTTKNITNAKINNKVKTQSSQCKSNTSNMNGYIQKDNELKYTQYPNKPKLHSKLPEKCQFSLPPTQTTINIEIYNMNLDQPCEFQNDYINNSQSEEYCELSLITQEVKKFNSHNNHGNFIGNQEIHDTTKPSKMTLDIKKRKSMVVLDKNEIKRSKLMEQIKFEKHHALDVSTGSKQLLFASHDKICKDECRNNNVKTNTKKRSHRQREVGNKPCTNKNISVNNITTHTHMDTKQTKRLCTIENERNIVSNKNGPYVDLAEKLGLNKKRENSSTHNVKSTIDIKSPIAGCKFSEINNPNSTSSNEKNELTRNKQAGITADNNSMAAKKLCAKDNKSVEDNKNGTSTEKIIEKEKSIRNKSIIFADNKAKESKMLCNLDSEETSVINNESLVQGIEEDTINKETSIAAHSAKETMTNVKVCTVYNSKIVQDVSTIQGNGGSKTVQYKASVIQEKIKNKIDINNKDDTEKGTLSTKLHISGNVFPNEKFTVQENEKGKSIKKKEGGATFDNTVKHTTLPKNSDTLENEAKIVDASTLQAIEKDKFIINNQDTVKKLCTTMNSQEIFNSVTSTTQEKDKFVTKQYSKNKDVTTPEDDNHHTENKPVLSSSLHSSLFKRYRIDTSAFLHKGENSRIIKARSKKDNSTVAVKILPKMSIESTHIAILRKLSDSDKNGHFSCIGIEEIFDAHRCWCVTMTFYPLNLSRALEINGTGFDIEKVQELSRQLLAALILLRTNEILHTDIKPSHILINAELTTLKLTGFDKAMYHKGIVALPQIGNLNYHSPEVFLGISFSYPADIWSAACTMFEMATKQILFEGVFPYAVLENITSLKGAFSDQLLRKGIHGHRYFSKKAKNYVSPESSIRIKLFDAYKASITNVDQIVQNREKILMFSELLDSMLALDDNKRESIELAYTHPFIYK